MGSRISLFLIWVLSTRSCIYQWERSGGCPGLPERAGWNMPGELNRRDRGKVQNFPALLAWETVYHIAILMWCLLERGKWRLRHSHSSRVRIKYAQYNIYLLFRLAFTYLPPILWIFEIRQHIVLTGTHRGCDDSPTNAGDIAFFLRDSHLHGARCDTQNFLVRVCVAVVEALC